MRGVLRIVLTLLLTLLSGHAFAQSMPTQPLARGYGGAPHCINDAPPNGPYHQLCLGLNSVDGGVLSYNANNGASPLPMHCNIKGVVSNCLSGSASTPDLSGIGYVSKVTCDGTTDVTAALNTDMAAQGGGAYYLPQHSQCVIGGPSDMQIPAGVFVRCQMPAGGYLPPQPQGCTLHVNPTHTIHSPTAPGNQSGLYGVRIIRQGYSYPTTLRASLTEIANYAGTAITCNGGTDFDVSHVLIVGFNWGFVNSCDRLRFTDSRIDATNGFQMTQCYDTCYLSDIEAWPFGPGTPYNTGPQAQTSQISGATNSSGHIRLTLSAAPPTALVTGDTVVVGNVGGVPNASGRWTITVVNATTVDLNGSSWSGGYTSSGTLKISAMRRKGIAFDIIGPGGGPFMSRLTSVSYDVGLHYGGSSDTAGCTDCWLEADVGTDNPDPVPTGILVDGNASHEKFTGGYVNFPGPSLVINSTGDIALTMQGTFLVGLGWRSGQYPIQLVRGFWIATGTTIENTDPTQYLMSAAATWGGVRWNAMLIPGGVVSEDPSLCPKMIQDGATGPCVATVGIVAKARP